MSRRLPIITNSWSPRMRPSRKLPRRRLRPPRRCLANRQSHRRLNQRNFTENMIEQKAAAGGQRDPRAVAGQVSAGHQPLDALPIDDAGKSEAFGDRMSVNALAQPQAHHQSLVSALDRRKSRLLGDAVAVAGEAREEIFGLPVAN